MTAGVLADLYTEQGKKKEAKAKKMTRQAEVLGQWVDSSDEDSEEDSDSDEELQPCTGKAFIEAQDILERQDPHYARTLQDDNDEQVSIEDLAGMLEQLAVYNGANPRQSKDEQKDHKETEYSMQERMKIARRRVEVAALLL
jgi:hypothetical protein